MFCRKNLKVYGNISWPNFTIFCNQYKDKTLLNLKLSEN